MARCGSCKRSFRTLEDEADGQHDCPFCGWNPHVVQRYDGDLDYWESSEIPGCPYCGAENTGAKFGLECVGCERLDELQELDRMPIWVTRD